jgi:FkbM family methyltransferase
VSTNPYQTIHRPMSRFLPRSARALLSHPRVEPRLAAILRSRVVRESPRFALRELGGRASTHVYRLREGGRRVLVAHGTPDTQALDQAFYQHAHEPSPGALAALREIGRPLRALDLGANVGLWGLWLHGRFPVERVIGLEPDPENVERHRRQIELNGLQDVWEIVEAAAVTADGSVSFTVGQATNGHVTATAETGTASVAGLDMFALLDGIDLLKIDIEGGEWPLLADARFAGIAVPVVMLEYHADGTSSPDPARDARLALEHAGYATESMAETTEGFGVVWGCKRRCASVST